MVSHRVVQAAVVALTVLALGASAAAQSTPNSSARAIGVRVVLPDGKGGVVASVTAPPADSATRVGGWTFGGGAVDTGLVSASGRTGARSNGSTANGSATVQSVSLFGGEITVGGVFAKAGAHAFGSGASGTLASSSLSNLVVLGQSVRAADNARFALPATAAR